MRMVNDGIDVVHLKGHRSGEMANKEARLLQYWSFICRRMVMVGMLCEVICVGRSLIFSSLMPVAVTGVGVKTVDASQAQDPVN
jgi:hypothetical protein